MTTVADVKSDCLIAFGSNLGDESAIFFETQNRLQEVAGIESLVSSQPLRTVPIGGPSGQPDFLNAAFRIQTTLSCTAIHQALVHIEILLGRERRARWGARKLDLDLLLYDNLVLTTEALTIPHPRMSFRRFVLQPASEIAGDMRHPVAGLTITELIRHLDSTPAEIVWVTRINSAVELIRDQLLHDPRFVNWKIHLIDEPASLERRAQNAKLLVWAADRPLGFKSPQFRGPQLQLGVATEKIAIELAAAMAAMEN